MVYFEKVDSNNSNESLSDMLTTKNYKNHIGSEHDYEAKPRMKFVTVEKSAKKSRGRPPKPKDPQIQAGRCSVCKFIFNNSDN